MVLALGQFLVVFAGSYSTPIVVNYITECFPELALEVSVVMGIYRQVFGLSLPFFIVPWTEVVGPGWYVDKTSYFFLGGPFALFGKACGLWFLFF